MEKGRQMIDDMGRAILGAVAWKMPFQNRGLTDRTIRALARYGRRAAPHSNCLAQGPED